MDSRTDRVRWRPQRLAGSQVETTCQGSSQELVEPGGDHEGRPQGGGSSEHGTGGGQSGQAAEMWKTTVEIPRIWDRTVS